MSKNKRFSDLWCSETGEIGITDNGVDLRFYSHEFEDFLNELHDENQYLKSLKWNQDCINKISIGVRQRQLLKKENEQLRQELAIYRKLASCSNCKYHNYDWYSDGDEFEVCDKGNDVTDGICKDWEELE